MREAARELKQPTRWVWVRVRLLRMPEAIQQKAAAGLLSQWNWTRWPASRRPTSRSKPPTRSLRRGSAAKGKFLPGLNKAYKRRRRRPPHREEINRMIERMLAAGISGLPPRVAAWCAGHIPDEELLKEIEAATPESSRIRPI